MAAAPLKQPAKPTVVARTCARVALVMLACALTGCAAQPISHWEQQAVHSPRKDLVSVIDEMDARRKGIDSVIVRMQVSLADSKSGKEYALNGAYLSDAQGRMRLRLQYQETTVLDMAMDGDRVEVWHPRKGKFYRGSRRALLNGRANPVALLAQVGPVHELLFPRPWAPSASARRLKRIEGREIVYVLGAPQAGAPLLKRMEIASGIAGAHWMDVHAAHGGLLGRVRYGNYLLPAATGTNGAQAKAGPVYPRSLLLTAHGGPFRLKLDLQAPQFNSDIAADRFKLDTPEGTTAIDLNQAIQRGDMPW